MFPLGKACNTSDNPAFMLSDDNCDRNEENHIGIVYGYCRDCRYSIDYERILYPIAMENISLDLDDGVKVNYAKLGKALKKVPGLEKSE